MFEDITQLPPFRRIDAPSFGLTEPDVRRALRRDDLLAVRRGVLVGREHVLGASDPRSEHLLMTQVALAGLRRGTRAAACLGTAALIHNLSRLGRSPGRVRLYRENGGTFRDDEVAI